MSMARSLTESSSFSKTSARHVASKIAADLHLIRLAHGEPSDCQITGYEAEMVELLAGRYVSKVIYGYQRNGCWIPPSLTYQARFDGTLTTDDRAGRIPRRCDVTGARFASFLTYSSAWSSLTLNQQASVEARLPFERGCGEEPGTESGIWGADKGYSHNGGGVARSALRPIG